MAVGASFITQPHGLALQEALCKNQGSGGQAGAFLGGPERGVGSCSPGYWWMEML